MRRLTLLALAMLLCGCDGTSSTGPAPAPPSAAAVIGTWDIGIRYGTVDQITGTLTFPDEDLAWVGSSTTFYHVSSAMGRTDCAASACWPAPIGKKAPMIWPIARFTAPDSVVFRDDRYLGGSLGFGSMEFRGRIVGSRMEGSYWSRETGNLLGSWHAERR